MKKVSLVLVMLLLLVLFEWFGLACPIHFFTGISCPGCGMSRAWASLIHLDFSKAFTYHPLFILPIFMVLGYFLRTKIPDGVYQKLLHLVLFLFLVVYLIRMLNPHDSIIVFEPENGLLWKLLF